MVAKPQVLVLFAGGGVQHHGLGALIQVIGAIDNNKKALACHAWNSPAPIFERDLSLDPDLVLHETGISAGAVDILQLSPPCQGFTTARKENKEEFDVRRWFCLSALDWVRHLKPKAVILENVAGFAEAQPGLEYWQVIREGWEAAAYGVSHFVLRAPDFGIPQTRNRFFAIGVLAGKGDGIPAPKPTHVFDEQVQGQVLELPHDEDYWLRDGLTHLTADRTADISKVKAGEPLYPGYNRPTFGERAETLVCNPNKVKYSKHIHPTKHRHLSVREYCHLQGVPDYQFPPKIKTLRRYEVIGNGNPPQMLRAVYQAVLKAL